MDVGAALDRAQAIWHRGEHGNAFDLLLNILHVALSRSSEQHVVISLKIEGPPPDGILHQILNRLHTMPTNADLTAEIEGLKTDLTNALDTEIAELTEKLNRGGVSAENIGLLHAFRESFKSKIQGVVTADGTGSAEGGSTQPPVEPPVA